MSSKGQVPVYYAAAEEVLTELGLRDRCKLTDVSDRQDSYRWCLLFEAGGHTFAVKGDEYGVAPAERELIKHKVRAGVLDHIIDFGI